MNNVTNNNKYNFYILTALFLFFVLINYIYFYLNLTTSLNNDGYAFQELFINYQAGFIRRGLLGEIGWQLFENFSVNPKSFFSILFFIIYLLKIFIFFYLVKKYIISKYILSLIIFSPGLLLFHIYSPDLYFLRDSFIKFSLLLHAVVFYKFYYLNNDNKKYFQFLNIIIIPFLFFLILVHEYQVFSISLHYLISLGAIHNKNDQKKLLFYYFPLFVPIILVVIFFGNQTQFEMLSEFLLKYDVKLNPYLGGGLYSYIGGFYKWHFFYFSYRDFINLFFSFILSFLVFYALFNNLIKQKILLFHSKYQKKYLYYFIPVLIPIFLTSDHGRNLSFLSFYFVIFCLSLKLKSIPLIKKIQNISNNDLSKIFLFLFIFFYIFMWKLDQVAGFGLGGKPNDIFQSSLFAEFIKFIKYLYIFIDINIYALPEIKL
jgi:hypothetical protein